MSGDEDGKHPQEGFVARWARLKRGEADTAASAIEPPQPTAAGGVTDEVKLAEADAEFTMPSLDDLKPDGDIRAFLDKRVPEELRRMAMRQMWTLDPVIRDFVEIAENQYDWNKADGVPGFGPLPEGTDIEALLAQATGAVPRAAEDAAVVVADGPDLSGQAADEVAAIAPPPGEPGPRGAEHAYGERADGQAREDEHAQVEAGLDADAGSRAHMTAAQPEAMDRTPSGPPPLLRRRHGGALPS